MGILGKSLGNLWEIRWKSRANPCEVLGKSVGNPMGILGKSLGNNDSAKWPQRPKTDIW